MISRYDFGTPEYDEAIALRDLVLRKPLGRSIVDDDLAPEYDQVHFGAYADGQMVGTATLQVSAADTYKMRQVAVHPEWRGRSVGRALIEACEAYAKTRSAQRLYCHARMEAKPFYESCGWTIEGDTFSEVGIPHVLMVSPRITSESPSG